MMKNNQIVSLDIGQPGGTDTATISCPDFIRRGMFPLSANIVAPVAAEPSLGVTIRAVAEGAYVSNVTAGSVAERSGLVPGMVITAINGIQLKGFDDAGIIRILEASAGALALSVIGRSEALILNRE